MGSSKTLIVSTMPESLLQNKELVTLWESADVLHPSSLNKIMPVVCLRTLFQSIRVSEEDTKSLYVKSTSHVFGLTKYNYFLGNL